MGAIKSELELKLIHVSKRAPIPRDHIKWLETHNINTSVRDKHQYQDNYSFKCLEFSR